MERPRIWKADSVLNESSNDPKFRRLIEDGEITYGEEAKHVVNRFIDRANWYLLTPPLDKSSDLT